jgi:hypothetical protein
MRCYMSCDHDGELEVDIGGVRQAEHDAARSVGEMVL